MILPYSFYCVVCLVYVFAKNDKKLSVFDVKTTIPLGLAPHPLENFKKSYHNTSFLPPKNLSDNFDTKLNYYLGFHKEIKFALR